MVRDYFPGRSNEDDAKQPSHKGRRLARYALATAVAAFAPDMANAQPITVDSLILSGVPSQVKQQAFDELNAKPFIPIGRNFDDPKVRVRLAAPDNLDTLSSPAPGDSNYGNYTPPLLNLGINISLKGKLVADKKQEKWLRSRQLKKDRKKSLFIVSCRDSIGTIHNSSISDVSTRRQVKLSVPIDVAAQSNTIDESLLSLDANNTKSQYSVNVVAVSETCGVFPRIMRKKQPNLPAVSPIASSAIGLSKGTEVVFAPSDYPA